VNDDVPENLNSGCYERMFSRKNRRWQGNIFMTLHFVNVCLFLLFCFFIGTNQSTLESDPIYWSAPNIKHYSIS